MSHYAIILAGGSGQRMNNALPKQFLLLDGIPVLMRTLHSFFNSEINPAIIVVLPATMQDYWMDLCHKYKFHVPHLITTGGNTRFQSVQNGLEFLMKNILNHKSENIKKEEIYIAVHDGARPLITSDLIDQAFQTTHIHGAVALGYPSTDSIRLIKSAHEKASNQAYPRELVYKMQTPQVFRASILTDAYCQPERPDFTDDASVVESKGYPITLLEGDHRNLKITSEGDLEIASLYLQQSKKA